MGEIVRPQRKPQRKNHFCGGYSTPAIYLVCGDAEGAYFRRHMERGGKPLNKRFRNLDVARCHGQDRLARDVVRREIFHRLERCLACSR